MPSEFLRYAAVASSPRLRGYPTRLCRWARIYHHPDRLLTVPDRRYARGRASCGWKGWRRWRCWGRSRGGCRADNQPWGWHRRGGRCRRGGGTNGGGGPEGGGVTSGGAAPAGGGGIENAEGLDGGGGRDSHSAASPTAAPVAVVAAPSNAAAADMALDASPALVADADDAIDGDTAAFALAATAPNVASGART